MPRWSVALALLGLAACAAADRDKLSELAELSLCAGPEGVYDCAPGRFERTFADRLPAMQEHREALIRIWLARLDDGNHAPAYALAWAGADEALPVLRRTLLADRSFYGWESSDALSIEARMRDDQYPRQVARILAIEHLASAELVEAVRLTDAERAALFRDAYAVGTPGEPSDAARWLLRRLAPGALDARTPAARAEPEPVAVDSELDGWVLVSHDSLGHHDVFPLARAHAGVLSAADALDGCLVLPGAAVEIAGRAVTLPRELFDNEVNRCLAEADGLAPGSAALGLGLSLRGRAIELTPETRALAEARALEALARVTGADPADFTGTASARGVGDADRVRVVVQANATRRPRTLDDDVTIPCASLLCGVPADIEPRASLVAIYALGAGGALVEALIVPSLPGGCTEAEHDGVSFVDLVLVDGAAPLFAIERTYCDGWDVELHVEGRPSSLVAVRGGSAI